MINILLVVEIDTHFTELSRMARLLASTGKYKPIFWFRYEYQTVDRDILTCHSEKWEVIFEKSSQSENPVIQIKQNSIKRRLRKIISFFVPKQAKWMLRFQREIKINKHILEQLAIDVERITLKDKISLIVLTEDNIGYFTNVIIKVGRKAKIPTIILPYTISNASEAAEYFYSYPAYSVTSTLIHRFVAHKFPHWKYEHHGRQLLRHPPATIWALENSEFKIEHPWQLNSERSSIVAVENERMHTYYLNEGLDESRLVLTGAIYDDVLAAYSVDAYQKKKNLIEKLGLIENQPILLCALPPDQFPRECEFADYANLVKFWMESLSAIQGWNVLIRPHPRQTAAEIAAFEKFGLKVTTADTASLVPLCDLYLASVSATIRWAIACGKPVINYDVYRMNYKDYAGVGGVLTMDNRDSYLSTLQKITQDHEFFAEIQKLQIESSQSWGKLDGKSSERIIRLFDNMIANNNPKA